MGQYRKKPVVIDAAQLSWAGWNEVCEVTGNEGLNAYEVDDPELVSDACGEVTPFINVQVETLEGTMLAKHGDWIIKGVNGEIYPCKPDIFAKTYDPVTP